MITTHLPPIGKNKGVLLFFVGIFVGIDQFIDLHKY